MEDVVNRVKTYFDSDILPSINNSENNNILIAAHGNSLRALLIVMKIYSSNDINSVELSTGIPIHIHFEDNLFSIKS